MINGNGLVIPCPEKVISIVCLERPTDVKELQGFLGSVNWFRKHIASHAQIQFPLNQLTRKDAKWEWNAGCETARCMVHGSWYWLQLRQQFPFPSGLYAGVQS